jgi:hypothetical protein
MKYFDVNAMIGEHFSPREGTFFQAGDLIKEMDFFGIEEALVYHGLARDYNNEFGNRKLIDCIRDEPRLHVCWVVGAPPFNPTITGRQMMKEALKAKVRAVRLIWGGPLPNTTVLDLDVLGNLFEALEANRMPMIVENDAGTEITGSQLGDLKNVCKTFPKLPVVLFSPKLSRDFSLIYSMLDRFRNFHLEISGIHGNGVMEEICRRFGAPHLIYGTNFPWCGSGQTRISLAYADLPGKDKEAIASGNLTRLIKGIRN